MAVPRAVACRLHRPRPFFRRLDCTALRVLRALGDLVFNYWLEYVCAQLSVALVDQALVQEVETVRESKANHPAAGKAGFALCLHIEAHFPGLPEPGR